MPPRPPLPQVKHRVYALRKALGLSQEELAKRAGLHRVYINRVEGGGNKASTVKMREALALGFQLTRADLDQYLEGHLPLEEAITRATKGDAVTPVPTSEVISKTPRFDAAVALLGDDVSPAVVREVRKRALGQDETKKTFEWAIELVEATSQHAQTLAEQARRFGSG